MKTSSFLLIASIASALVGCNLSEAERMDLNRREVGSIQPAMSSVAYEGGSSIPLSDLLTASAWTTDVPSRFRIEWTDLGVGVGVGVGVDDKSWQIVARWRGSPLFVYSTGSLGNNGQYTTISVDREWTNHLDEVSWSLLASTDTGWQETRPDLASRLKIIDDRPALTMRLVNDSSRIKTGDTIAIDLTNDSPKDSILVASDYSGMRMVGDYVANLRPGQSARLRWLVLAPSGQSFWLDLGWGTYGQSQRFNFTIH